MSFNRITPNLYLEADKGKAGDPPEKPEGPHAGEDNGGEETDPQETPKEKTFTQSELNRIVSERLEKERRRQETQAQKDREAQEAQLLKEKEDYKALAEKQEKKLADLETRTAELDALKENHARYQAALSRYLEAERKDLPKHLLSLLDKLDPVDQLEYLAANAAEISKPKSKGVPETPPASDRSQLTEQQLTAARNQTAAMYRSLF